MRFFLLSLTLFVAANACSQVVISEFVANNGASFDDVDGDSSDWIELHNQGSQINLGGYSLTDDPAVPQKWTLPSGRFLGTNAYFVIFASGKDRAVLGQELHTNFLLESLGDYLALADPSGNIIQEFSPRYPSQKRDIAYGTGSGGRLGYLDPPTPNAANGPSLTDFVADTIFSLKRGFYSAPISVAITCATPGSSIRYTTNGTKPSAFSGVPYNGPITISSTTVLRALAYKSGLVPSNVDAQSYLFTGDIIRQPEMNSSIVNATAYRSEIQPGLRGLPVVSLSFNTSDLFGQNGIHNNPEFSGRSSEREVHFEYFNPADPLDSTHEPGGVRIHGGNSRLHPKKSFRLYFRNDYGKPRLKHDLFPGSSVDSFKHLLLRGGGHDAWTFRADWNQATLIRNEFLHRLQLSMGQPSPIGRMVSLYLNGDYWGVYELQELPHANYNADHHGGQPEDWDVLKHGAVVEAGNSTAWDDMIDLAQAGIASASDYAAIQEFVDLENFADSMIHRIWSSDEDWLAPEFRNGDEISSFGDDKNWYVARRSRNGAGKFFFYSWDAEMSMGIPFSASRSFQNDFTRVNNNNSPGIIYQALRQHEEFQLLFADRLHKHLFNDGALTMSKLNALWDPLEDIMQMPIVGESARWGVDSWSGNTPRGIPYSRNNQWRPAVSWVRSQFLVRRSSTVLNQFRNIGLYPRVTAPTPSPQGTLFANSISLSLTNSTAGATIFFTTDGNDPRLPSSSNSSVIPLVTDNQPVQILVPNAATSFIIGTTWRNIADPSNIASWLTEENGVGFEGSPASNPNYTNFINTTLTNMRFTNPSVYLRFKFDIPDQATLDSLNTLILKMRYDDGFVAYLNGTEIESQNVNASNWNSAASATHNDIDAIKYQSFDQSSDRGLLQVGDNVLVIHGFNRSTNDADFLIQAILEGDTGLLGGGLAESAQAYTGAIAIDQSTWIQTRTRDAAGTWSALTSLLYRIGTPASLDNLKITEIHYHPTDPATAEELALSSSDNDFEFLELQNVSAREIDLSFYHFTKGIDFTFPSGTSLAAGQFLLLVSNREAFLARYGSAAEPAIFGEFANDSNLSNKGERLALRDPLGTSLFSFTFDDDTPWPLTPDGGGPSLVLIDPLNTPETELDEGTRWRASFLNAGAPDLADAMSFDLWTRLVYGPLDGTDPTIAGPLVVPSGPGNLSNLMLYAQGQDLSNGEVTELNIVRITPNNNEEYLTLTFQIRDNLSSTVITPEVSEDLITWSPDIAIVSQSQNGDGTSIITVRDLVPLTSGQQRFIRLRGDR
jgi:hypothetical protein